MKVLRLVTVEELEERLKSNWKPTKQQKICYKLMKQPFNQKDYIIQ